VGEVDVIKMIQDVLSMSQTGAIIKIAFMVAVVSFAIWWKLKGKKIKRAQARSAESKAAQANHDSAVSQNRLDNIQVQSDSKRIDDFTKGGS
jgi:hypothetical protein